MSGACLCSGLYSVASSGRRRSSIGLIQLTRPLGDADIDEDEISSLEDITSNVRSAEKIKTSRKISFDFSGSTNDVTSYDIAQVRISPPSPTPSPEQDRSLGADDVLASLSRTSVDSEGVNQDGRCSSLKRALADWSIDPDGFITLYWKAAVSVAVVYNCIMIVARMAFEELTRESFVFIGLFSSKETFSYLDTLCDVIYLLDMVVEAKTSFLSDGIEVSTLDETLMHYKEQPFFQYDLIAICPTQTMMFILRALLWIFPFDGLAVWCQIMFRASCPPVLRINRLIKYHTMQEFFLKTESRTNKPNFLRAFKLGTHLCLVIHWFACLYYMMSEYEGLGSNDWVYPAEDAPIRFSKKYITCMFWSVMTLTTIGERPPPQTELEYIFTGLTFLIGVFVFAAVVGNVGDVISNMNASRRDFQARMDQIKFYMDHRNVPEHLQNRVKRWAEYTWNRTKCIDEPSVLQLLPDRLRTEVAIHVHLSILKKLLKSLTQTYYNHNFLSYNTVRPSLVSIFEECEEGLLRELVLKLRSQIFSPGDYICRIGEIGRDMYIINHGQVEILFPDQDSPTKMKRVGGMSPGNFFGEISLLKLDDGQNRRTADVRSVGYSELLCLSRRDLIMALAEYPEAKKILEEYGRKRYNNTKRSSPAETDESRPSSPPPQEPFRRGKKSLRTVFEQVMRHEGFANLLEADNAKKDKEISEIKASINQMKSENDTVTELNCSLKECKAQLKEAQTHAECLERIIHTLLHVRQPTNTDEDPRPGDKTIGCGIALRWPDLLRTYPDANESIRAFTEHKRGGRGLTNVPKSLAVEERGFRVSSLYKKSSLSRRHSWDASIPKQVGLYLKDTSKVDSTKMPPEDLIRSFRENGSASGCEIPTQTSDRQLKRVDGNCNQSGIPQIVVHDKEMQDEKAAVKQTEILPASTTFSHTRCKIPRLHQHPSIISHGKGPSSTNDSSRAIRTASHQCEKQHTTLLSDTKLSSQRMRETVKLLKESNKEHTHAASLVDHGTKSSKKVQRTTDTTRTLPTSKTEEHRVSTESFSNQNEKSTVPSNCVTSVPCPKINPEGFVSDEHRASLHTSIQETQSSKSSDHKAISTSFSDTEIVKHAPSLSVPKNNKRTSLDASKDKKENIQGQLQWKNCSSVSLESLLSSIDLSSLSESDSGEDGSDNDEDLS